jgi:cold shock CspA family protein
MTEPSTEEPPAPYESDGDPFLGEATGNVMVFHRTHGFIRTGKLGLVFVHVTGLEDGRERLEPGQHVQARIFRGLRGRYAREVKVLREAPAPTNVAEGAAENAGEAAPATDPPVAVRPRSPNPPVRSLQYVTIGVARRLGEQMTAPVSQIRLIVQYLGAEVAWEMVKEVEKIEAEGGMLIPDGSRRRTPGGIFFLLAKQRLRPDDRMRIFPTKALQAQRKRAYAAIADATAVEQGLPPKPVAPPPPPPVTWATRGPLIEQARAGQGRAASVKATIIGRPTSIIEQGSTVTLKMVYSGPKPSVPKGVLLPPEVPETVYTVYVGAKQWRGVAEAIKNPEDVLILEGAQTWNADRRTIDVYTTKVMTKLQQRGKRSAPPSDG